MDNFLKRSERSFHNMKANKPKMHLLDKPTGFASGLARGNLGHQMRYSVEMLECELVRDNCPHVLQLVCKGDPCEPNYWTFYADGECIADGNGDFTRECFEQSAYTFLGVLRDAVCHAQLTTISQSDYQLLAASRKIARIEKTL